MLQIATIIGLCLVMCVYGISVIGVKKYEIITTAAMLGKREILGFVIGIGMVFLGILMQVSRVPMVTEGGIVTSSIGVVADLFFAKNAAISSFAVFLVTMIPAYVFQIFALSKIAAKLNIPYVKLFFYSLIYACNLGLYERMNFSAGQAVLYYLLSAFVYYLVMVCGKVSGKKDYMYLLCFAGLFVVLALVEKGVCLSMLLLTAVTMAEGIVMAWYVSKSFILRRVLANVGVIALLGVFTWINTMI